MLSLNIEDDTKKKEVYPRKNKRKRRCHQKNNKKKKNNNIRKHLGPFVIRQWNRTSALFVVDTSSVRIKIVIYFPLLGYVENTLNYFVYQHWIQWHIHISNTGHTHTHTHIHQLNGYLYCLFQTIFFFCISVLMPLIYSNMIEKYILVIYEFRVLYFLSDAITLCVPTLLVKMFYCLCTGKS